MKNAENAIEFLTGEQACVVSFTSPKHCNRIKKLYAKSGSEFIYLHENADNSICAKIPLSWLRIAPPKQMNLTEDERRIYAERLRKNIGRG